MISKLATVFGVAVLSWMVAGHSPSGVGWGVFLDDPASVGRKVVFLAEMYLLPAAIAFLALLAFQVVQRISASGAGVGTVFGLGVAAWSMMLYAFSVAGSTARPAVIGGMAAGLAFSSQIYAMSLRRGWFGLRWPCMIFRWNKAAVEAFNREAMKRRAFAQGT